MIEYREALQKIHEHLPKPKRVNCLLREALGRVLAKDIFSPTPFPYFDQSAVDGYALGDGGESLEFKVLGEIKAGDGARSSLGRREAMRIFTGASVPRGTLAVAMQEESSRINGKVLISKGLASGENIRKKGEDIQKGEKVLTQGTVLGPVHLALLAALGMKKAPVFKPPQVTFFTTGSELVTPGKQLKHGQIYDTNSTMLEALLAELQADALPLPSASDDPAAIRRRIRQGLRSDVLIISGGVSVGDYDFVKDILKEEGVCEIFWKVNIKPAKPLFFGKRGRTLVFGLPGNPVSVFIAFEEFVRPVLLHLQGRKTADRPLLQARLETSFQNESKTRFLWAALNEEKKKMTVRPLKGQGSHRIGSLAQAHALIRLEPYERLRQNQWVWVKKIRKEN